MNDYERNMAACRKTVVSQIWDDFLVILGQEVGSRVVDTWFKAVTLRQWDPTNRVAYLEAPNSFVKDWIKSNYLETIQFNLSRLLQVHEVHVIILDTRSQIDMSKNTASAPAVQTESKQHSDSGSLMRVAPARMLSHINKGYKFDTFVVGPHNCMAYAAACAVVEKPGIAYNPLYICSGSGLGKTHLLHAIGNGIKSNNAKSMVMYQAADRFVYEFVHALRSDKIHQFHAKYQHVDVLLMDDVQFISRGEKTQEVFFNIFNGLYESQKQIVFSGDTLPRNMKGLNEGLQSRLSWGLVTDIEAPDLDTRVAILKKKAELGQECINDDVATFIASSVNTSIRELEGALVRVLAFAAMTKQPVSIELARKILGRTVMPESKKSISVDFDCVMKSLCRRYPYSVEEIKSKKRSKDLAFVRHLAIYLMKKITDKSLRDIGKFFGGRDHATIIHALERMEKAVAADADLQEIVRQIEIDILHV
jgi:chromosomal replication initiator protein